MLLIEEHINEYLPEFIGTPDDGFEDVYNRLFDSNKSRSKKLLVYLDKLLNRSCNYSNKKLKFTHIHLDNFPNEYLIVICEFILIKFFLWGFNKDVEANENDDILIRKLNKLTSIQNTFKTYPPFVSLKKPNRETQAWLKEKNKNKNKIDFFTKLIENGNKKFLPNTLCNLLNRDYENVIATFATQQYCIGIESIEESNYVILNSEKRRDAIDKLKCYNGNSLLDSIENIILFDCEQKQINRDFNQVELQQWNTQTSNFKNLIIISSNEGLSNFLRLKLRIDRVKSRYQQVETDSNNNTYTILPSEIDYLLERSRPQKSNLFFWGEEYLNIWEEFKQLLLQFEGLYELRSLKMMSIYSLAFNDEIKKIILANIFSDSSINLITSDTKDAIRELSSESINELRDSLCLVLDSIIQSAWKNTIIEFLKEKTLMLVNQNLIFNKPLLNEIAKELNIKSLSSFVTWQDITRVKHDMLILDYRDIGPYPYIIAPNVNEGVASSFSSNAIFLSCFFKNKFELSNYIYRKDIIAIISNSIRDTEFNKGSLTSKNYSLKPENEDTVLWDLENSYQGRDSNTIKVFFKDNLRSKTYSSSELFIISNHLSKIYNVVRLDSLLEDSEYEDLFIQALDDIHSEFNLYEKLADVAKEESELKKIREKYDLDKEIKPHKLWKILLNKQAAERGVESLYSDLKTFLHSKKISIVSANTFKNHWLDLENNALIPRQKSVFFYLCQFLELPNSYYRIMLRLKNVEKQATASSSKQMDNLLRDIINDGCFDEDKNIESILTKNKQKYSSAHDFDEIGLEEERIVSELKALVDLLKPYVILIQVDKMEIN